MINIKDSSVQNFGLLKYGTGVLHLEEVIISSSERRNPSIG